MIELNIKYSLKPRILQYGNKKEFRSIDAVNKAASEFVLKPVLVLSDFSRFEKTNFNSVVSQEDIAGNVLSVNYYDPSAGVIELKVVIDKPDAIAKVTASPTKEPEARVHWICEIEEQLGEWEGEPYEWVQTKLQPVALVLKFD